MQDSLDSANFNEGNEGPKSEDDNIEVLSGEGDRFEKSLRDRATGLSLQADDQEIEAW